MQNNKKKYALIVSAVIALGFISLYDFSITSWIYREPFLSKDTVRFFAQSLFEGKPIGFGDFFTFLALFSPLGSAYYSKRNPKLASALKYIFYTSFLMVVWVHSLKAGLGRARPKDVFSGEYGFQFWFTGGPVTLGEGTGSFPSGHTATVAVFFAFSFMLQHLLNKPIITKSLQIFTLVSCIAMGLTRSMAGQHWVTDWLASIVIIYFILQRQANIYFNNEWQTQEPFKIFKKSCLLPLSLAVFNYLWRQLFPELIYFGFSISLLFLIWLWSKGKLWRYV